MKRILGILGIMVFMFAISSVQAQEQMDVPIVAGETTEVQLGTADIQVSEMFGGLVGNIWSTVEKYIDFGGVKVWKNTAGTGQEMEFDLLIVPVDSTPIFSTLIIDGIFETSEEVEINNVTAIWDTNYATIQTSIGADDQDLVLMDGVDVGWFTEIGSGPSGTVIGDAGYWPLLMLVDVQYNNGNIGANPVEDCDTNTMGITCPSDAQLLAIYGGTTITSKTVSDIQNHEDVVNLMFVEIDGVMRYVTDYNRNHVFDFGEVVSAYCVEANAGEALAILPEETYSLWGILPA